MSYETFIAEIEKVDPERYAIVAAKYPVLSKHQMRHKSRREIAISQLRYYKRFISDSLYSDIPERGDNE